MHARRLSFALCIAVLLMGQAALAEEGFEKIFDGKTLRGWEGNKALWSVQDGAITGKTDGEIKFNQFLIWTGGEVENFELRLKYRIVNGNSGIQYRSRVIDPQKYIVGGYQADFEAGDQYSGILYEERGKRGIMANRGQKVTHNADGTKQVEQFADSAEIQKGIKKEDWNDYRIVVKDDHYTHYINGTKTAEVIDKDPANRSLRGVLAFQVHVGPAMEVQFKDVLLKQLPGTDIVDPDLATRPEKMTVAEGFNVQMLYNVPSGDNGSWVNLCVDPQGRIIASDQAGKLYRITPAGLRQPAWKTRVEPIDLPIGQAQGLLHAFGSLYVVVNGNINEGAGLYRVSDTDDDDQYDKVELLRKINGGGEHGPHAVVLAPDGQSLYVIGGNHTDLPEYDASRIPTNWDEDQLLPRMWDATGHAVGKLAPAGWVCKVDPEGKYWEVISIGFRNEFDIAFNKYGDLFTFDADMEWDVGTPWYRPTRVCHVTSGSEFGWRSGTGKWPVYYPDSLPPVVDIGPGSPTGVAFGYGADFPKKYQDALLICDWSFGKMYAVHMTPDGSTYSGKTEQFIAATPLPLTDLVVNPVDGALYFAIGGRGTQSALYRVTYKGSRVDYKETEPGRLAGIRRSLEIFHGKEDPRAVEAAWPYLGSADRFVRYAARIAVESQPVQSWQDKALAETDPQALLTALLALARQGGSEVGPQLLHASAKLTDTELTEAQFLEALRVLQLAFIRLGEPAADQASEIAEYLGARYPAQSVNLNYELSRILVYLQSPTAASKTVDLLLNAPTQEEQIHYALVLRNLDKGWTPELRRQYFNWFNQARGYKGGNSFAKFIVNIRNDALARLSEQEKAELADVLKEFENPVVVAAVEPREFVKEWKKDELVELLNKKIEGRNFENGRRMFGAAQCYNCHRLNAEGGAVGPDLSAVAGRLSASDLVDAIVDPNKDVSDQYRNTIFTLKNGQQVVGRVANLNRDVLMIVTNQLAPGDFTPIKRDDIVVQFESPISPMMAGLLNTLTEEDVLDLMAYLLAGGDRSQRYFQ